MFLLHVDIFESGDSRLLLILFFLLTDVDTAKVLTQTPAVLTVPVGQQVVFNCDIQRDDSYVVSFYKQVPGDAPQLVLYYYHTHSSPTLGEGFPSSRFDAKSSSPTNYKLIIKQAEVGDSAEYYCSTWDSSASVVVAQ